VGGLGESRGGHGILWGVLQNFTGLLSQNISYIFGFLSSSPVIDTLVG